MASKVPLIEEWGLPALGRCDPTRNGVSLSPSRTRYEGFGCSPMFLRELCRYLRRLDTTVDREGEWDEPVDGLGICYPATTDTWLYQKCGDAVRPCDREILRSRQCTGTRLSIAPPRRPPSLVSDCGSEITTILRVTREKAKPKQRYPPHTASRKDIRHPRV